MSHGKQTEMFKISGTTSVLSKTVLTTEEAELYELTKLAGVVMDKKVFKILLELLQMNVAPIAIESMLRTMSAASGVPSSSHQKKSQSVSGNSMSDLSSSSSKSTRPQSVASTK